MNVIFQRLIAQNKLSQNSTHAGHDACIFFMCDCDFYQYYTLVLYSLIMICIFTLFIFYLSRFLCVVSFRGEILSQVGNVLS